VSANGKIESVTLDLEGRVKAQEWGEEESLPSQNRLSAQYGVSPTTVALAIRALQKKGILHVVPGKGAFVASESKGRNVGHLAHTIGLRGSYVFRPDGSPTNLGSYGGMIVQAIWGAAQADHSSVLLLPNSSEHGALTKQACLSRGVNGVIFLGGESYEEAMELRQSGFPVIVANEPPTYTPINFVNYDHGHSLREGLRRFIDVGHRRVAVLYPSTTMPGSYEKLKPDYINILEEAGIAYNPKFWRFVQRDPSSSNEMHEASPVAEELFSLTEPPTAFFCYSPYLVEPVRRAAVRAGLSVPEDISIIASPFDQNSQTDISGYVLRHEALAQELLKGIHETIENPFHCVQKLLPLNFIDRGSVRPPSRRD